VSTLWEGARGPTERDREARGWRAQVQCINIM